MQINFLLYDFALGIEIHLDPTYLNYTIYQVEKADSTLELKFISFK
jgi:hypothetical protein